MGCSTVIVGKDVSETGLVLVAHNEDDYGRYVVYHGILPESSPDLSDPEQAFLPAEEGLAKIPQAAHTFRAYWSEVVAPNGGASTSDMFYNQNGVLVTSNSGQLSKPDPKDPDLVKEGGIAYNLRRAIGERAKSARHGVQIALSLLAEWGYALPGRSYTIADKDEAWNVQAVRGHYYAAARVPDRGVMTMPNHITIHNLKEFPVSLAMDPQNPKVPMDADFSEGAILYPADLVENAIHHGWYVPRQPGNFDDFDYGFVYQAPGYWKIDGNTCRQAREMQVVMGLERPKYPPDPLAKLHGDTNPRLYPFCVYPDKPVSIEQLGIILSSHFEAFPENKVELGPGASPHLHNGIILCYGDTSEAFIARFAEIAEQTTIYTAFGRSCQLPFIALHPLNGVPEGLNLIADPARAMHDHLKQVPERVLWQDNIWWREFRRFQELADLQFSILEIPLSRLRTEHLRREKAANEAILAAGGDLAAFDRERVAIAVNEWRDFAAGYFHLAEIQPHAPFIRGKDQTEIRLKFCLPDGEVPMEAGLVLVPAMLDLTHAASPVIPGSLQQEDDGSWSAAFEAAPIRAAVHCAGLFDCYLGGLDSEGNPFAGQIIVEGI